jgi:hypothetical protein
MSPFARNSFLPDNVFVKNSYKAFHETMTNASLTDTKSRTHRWAKVISTQCLKTWTYLHPCLWLRRSCSRCLVFKRSHCSKPQIQSPLIDSNIVITSDSPNLPPFNNHSEQNVLKAYRSAVTETRLQTLTCSHESSPHLSPYFSEIPSSMTLPSTTTSAKWSLPFRYSDKVHLSLKHHATRTALY